MQRRRLIILTCLFTTLVWCGVTSAQPIEQANLDQAESHFFTGVKHFRANRFDDAAMSFQSAYNLTGERILLFNIARCQDQTGDVGAAVAWYRSYLKTKPADETGIIHRIKLLGADSKDIMSAGRKKRVVRRASAQQQLQSIEYRWMKWGLLGAGVASLTAATSLGLQSLDEAEKSRDLSGTVAAEQWGRQADRHAFAADVLAVVGVVAAGTATYLFISEAMVDDDAVGIVPDAGGASLIYRASF